ncbi:hypothetical protein [Granulicoccus sp. GXG6511]|uniref:hypothetical protein n=1 Tax=Granulicoccus sp. GXG6511 TaxID=3381351 RepID=UPI003D7D5856
MWRTSNRNLPALLLLGMLVVLDVLMIVVDAVLHTGLGVAGPVWSVTQDGGYAEFLQYAKFAWCGLLLVVLARTGRTKALLLWVPFIAYLALDDVLQIHENVGAWLAEVLQIPHFGLRSYHIGELLVAVAAIAVGLGLVLIGCFFSRPVVRGIFIDILLLVGLMAFFAVGVDAVHSLLGAFAPIEMVLGLVEDGGEMLALSLLVAYLFHTALGHQSPRMLQRVRARIPGIRRLDLGAGHPLTPAEAERGSGSSLRTRTDG